LVPREVRALEQGTGCNAGMVHQRLLRAAAQLSGSMISVDATRCACCGACISVCPLDALEQRRYEQEWAAGIGRRMARNYRLRARFRPHQRVGERFMRLFALTMRVAL
jgi:ferredoxin